MGAFVCILPFLTTIYSYGLGRAKKMLKTFQMSRVYKNLPLKLENHKTMKFKMDSNLKNRLNKVGISY